MDIQQIIKDTPNDMELGAKYRALKSEELLYFVLTTVHENDQELGNVVRVILK